MSFHPAREISMPSDTQQADGSVKIDYSRIYFAAADSHSFMDSSAFYKALVLSSLFHGDLVIPDVYFFIGSACPDAFLSERSLALELLKSGHLQPWFRTETHGSFITSIKDIKQSGILGLREDAAQIAEYLERSVIEHDSYKFGYWGQIAGASFDRVVRNFLEREEPPVRTDNVLKLWDRTRPWRVKAVAEARARSHDGTLRRGEIVYVIGKQLGWDRPEKVSNPEQLLEFLKQDPRRIELRHFFAWLAQSYYKNQADVFGIDRVFFETAGFDQLGPYSFGAFDIEAPELDQERITPAILVPSVESLLKMDPKELIAVRNGDEAREYFDTLNRWKKGDSTVTSDDLFAQLAKYAEALRRWFTQKKEPVIFGTLQTWLSENERKIYWLKRAIDLAMLLTPSEVLSTNAKIFIFSGKVAWGLLKYEAPVREILVGARQQEFVTLNRERGFSSRPLNIGVS